MPKLGPIMDCRAIQIGHQKLRDQHFRPHFSPESPRQAPRSSERHAPKVKVPWSMVKPVEKLEIWPFVIFKAVK